MHIHVGHNMPGYLPESEPHCLTTVTAAVDALRFELDQQCDYYYDVEEHEAAEAVEIALSSIGDGDVTIRAARGEGSLFLFHPQAGASSSHWLVFADGDRESCEL